MSDLRLDGVEHDPAHLIVEAASAFDLACGLKSIVARFARAVNRTFARAGAVLADRAHVHVLRAPREVRNALSYVLLNARKHAAALGRRVRPGWTVDPASSGRWFQGWREARTPARDAPAVAEARSWLLRIGWRRHRLVSVGEVPGGGRELI
jgi:hypothetical protein